MATVEGLPAMTPVYQVIFYFAVCVLVAWIAYASLNGDKWDKD